MFKQLFDAIENGHFVPSPRKGEANDGFVVMPDKRVLLTSMKHVYFHGRKSAKDMSVNRFYRSEYINVTLGLEAPSTTYVLPEYHVKYLTSCLQWNESSNPAFFNSGIDISPDEGN